MKISIIIPSYNTAHYLNDAINSVLNSELSDFEIIVIDDGSTDDTKKIITPFQEKSSQIKYIYQDNKGLAGARNTGIANSAGEFLVFLDSDDIILPEKLKVQAEFLQNNNEYDVVYSDTVCFIDNYRENELKLDLPKYQGNILKSLLYGNFIHVNSVMVRKTAVVAVNCFNEKYRELEDWDLWLRMSLNGSNFGYINQLLSKVRVRPDSMTVNQDKMNKAMLNVLNIFLQDLKNNESAYSKVKKHFFHSLGLFTLKTEKNKIFWVAYKGLYNCGLSYTFVFLKLIVKRLALPFLKNQNKTTYQLEAAWKNAK